MNSSLLLSITTFAYLFCALLYLVAVIFRLRPLLRFGTISGFATWLLQTAAILLRWKESYDLGFGHAPLSNLYESLVFGAWAVMLIYLLTEVKTKQRALGVFPATVAFLAMAYASFSPEVSAKIQPLLPALKSNWLIAHVVTCFLGYAAFAISFGLSAVYVFHRYRHAEASGSRYKTPWLPDRKHLDEINYRMVLFGFLLLSVGIITGAVWANSAWGSYWSWDPKETWSLITWLIYAALLHARAVQGWRGDRVAWLSMVGFVSVLFTYFGVNFLLSGLHSYGSS